MLETSISVLGCQGASWRAAEVPAIPARSTLELEPCHENEIPRADRRVRRHRACLGGALPAAEKGYDDPAGLAKLIREGKPAHVLVDVRTPAEYEAGHIPTASTSRSTPSGRSRPRRRRTSSSSCTAARATAAPPRGRSLSTWATRTSSTSAPCRSGSRHWSRGRNRARRRGRRTREPLETGFGAADFVFSCPSVHVALLSEVSPVRRSDAPGADYAPCRRTSRKMLCTG